MNLYELLPTKELKRLKEDKTYITENLINSFHIIMPSTFGDYAVNELNFELRVYLPTVNSNGTTEYTEYMGYPLTVENDEADVPITNDITEAVQIVKIMILATKDGNVIGKTNFVNKQIYDAPIKGEPLTPREQFDTVIREQRETIEEQGQAITEQQGTITEQGEQITELNGEVTELTNENGELKTQHTADQNTIQYLIDNPPEAHLQPKSVTPTNQMQVVEPDEGYQGLSTVTVGATTPPRLQSKQVAPSMSTSYVTADNGYDGLSSVTVDNVDASIDSDIQPQNIKEGVDILGVEGIFNPFPYNSAGGVYITEVDDDGYPTKYLFKNLTKVANPFCFKYDRNARVKSVIFENCTGITQFTNSTNGGFMFNGLRGCTKIQLPENLIVINSYEFADCGMLKTINIPATVVSLQGGTTAFQNFQNCVSLENVTIESGFNCNGLNLSVSTRYSHDTILSWFNALADRTGQTAYTLTIGTTNLNKMTAEEKAIAINKNWNLA